jgi:hypothetical protein
LKNLDDVFKNWNFDFDGGGGRLGGEISIKMIRFTQNECSVVHHVIDNVVYINAEKVMLNVFFFANFFIKEI